MDALKAAELRAHDADLEMTYVAERDRKQRKQRERNARTVKA